MLQEQGRLSYRQPQSDALPVSAISCSRCGQGLTDSTNALVQHEATCPMPRCRNCGQIVQRDRFEAHKVKCCRRPRRGLPVDV